MAMVKCSYLVNFTQLNQQEEKVKYLSWYFFLISGGISVSEFSRALDGENYDKFYTYLENMQKNHPERKVRYSDTVFLRPYVNRELFDKLRYRLVKQLIFFIVYKQVFSNKESLGARGGHWLCFYRSIVTYFTCPSLSCPF